MNQKQSLVKCVMAVFKYNIGNKSVRVVWVTLNNFTRELLEYNFLFQVDMEDFDDLSLDAFEDFDDSELNGALAFVCI